MVVFAWLSLFLKGALRPLTQKGVLPSFFIFILHLDSWLLKCCCEGMPAAMTTGHWGWSRGAVFITVLHLLFYKADGSTVFLTCAIADMVVPGSEGFYFFISFIMFLFLSSPVVSQFRQEEWLPRGPCGVTGTCMMCVVPGRAVHTEVDSVAQLRPLIQRRGDCISSWGVVGEEQTIGVLCGFQLVHCRNCSWVEPFESCVTWEKVSALMKH